MAKTRRDKRKRNGKGRVDNVREGLWRKHERKSWKMRGNNKKEDKRINTYHAGI